MKGYWQPPPDWSHKDWHNSYRHHRRRTMFMRFVMTFGMMVLLVLGGMGIMAFLLTRVFGGGGQTAVFVWITGCSLAFVLPAFAVRLAIRTFRSTIAPITDVMSAADAVAEGDLTVRVPEQKAGEFGRLAKSFNNMIQELEQAEQQRRNLTADVAHELRTPLHIIQGNLEGVLDGVYEPTPEHINATLEETRLLARLVEDLRTLSLAEAGQLPLQLEQVNIAELLTDAQTSFSGQAEAASIDLIVKTKGDLWLTADPNRLDQILGNLLVNALRHTPPGGKISLCAETIGENIHLTISDTGEGIAAEDLPHIFDRFWRGDRARTHSDGTGGGLGLAIVKQLVGLHNGRITATSQPQQGTTFTIELPHKPN